MKSFIVIFLGSLLSNATCMKNYDFIIVGGGTAGLAVARRLAENGNHSVLVLESGSRPKRGMEIPVYAPRFLPDQEVTFRYRTTRQRNSGLKHNGVHILISGRMLSGTSSLNYAAFNRGNPRDYDNWGNLTQDTSWNYNNMFKYFKKVETYEGDFPSDQHGCSGPITVGRQRYAPGLRHWLSAGRYLGYPIVDPNGPQQRSFSPIDFAKRFGRRVDSFTGYVKPILSSSSNLRIVLNTNVTKIIFEGKRAVGIRFQSKAPELQGIPNRILYANKEIIVSAGAFGSPILLMRSGIGPRQMLRESGIPLVQDLPVGKNLHDNVHVPMYVIINNRSESIVQDTDRDLTPRNWEYYNKFGDGPYSLTAGSSGQAFLVSSIAKSNGEADWPDINLQMSHSAEPFYHSILRDNRNPNEVMITPAISLSRPKSRGYITLNPQDPFGSPVININFLSQSRDLDALLYGVKEVIGIHESTPSYRKLGARIPYIDIPMCRKFKFRSDDYWRCYIRYESGFVGRAAGSCRMGNGRWDSDAVVDTKLKVIGVRGLRVVDASIMPVETNANLHAVVYAIAEKASDMILKDWELKIKFQE